MGTTGEQVVSAAFPGPWALLPAQRLLALSPLKVALSLTLALAGSGPYGQSSLSVSSPVPASSSCTNLQFPTFKDTDLRPKVWEWGTKQTALSLRSGQGIQSPLIDKKREAQLLHVADPGSLGYSTIELISPGSDS